MRSNAILLSEDVFLWAVRSISCDHFCEWTACLKTYVQIFSCLPLWILNDHFLDAHQSSNSNSLCLDFLMCPEAFEFLLLIRCLGSDSCLHLYIYEFVLHILHSYTIGCLNPDVFVCVSASKLFFSLICLHPSTFCALVRVFHTHLLYCYGLHFSRKVLQCDGFCWKGRQYLCTFVPDLVENLFEVPLLYSWIIRPCPNVSFLPFCF